MNYKPRKGIVHVSICGAQLLIPSREASEYCHGILKLSLPELLIWRQLEKGADLAATEEQIAGMMMKPVEEIKPRLNAFYNRLLEKGYIESVEETE